MKRVIHIVLLVAFFTGIASSQTTVKVDLMKNSWIAINGTTNILTFKLIQNGEKFLGKSVTVVATQHQNKLYLSHNQLLIQVENFASDNPMALRDFKKLINSEKYPTIKVQLNYIDAKPSAEKDVQTKGTAYVNITITGITHQYSIPVTSNYQNENISVFGDKKISIRDFGLEPPTEMLGLIKVSEWININFHLMCKLTVNGGGALAQSGRN